MYYNFARLHQTLRVMPAMEAEIAEGKRLGRPARRTPNLAPIATDDPKRGPQFQPILDSFSIHSILRRQ